MISASLAPSRPSAMLLRIVSSNSVSSWLTMAIDLRSVSSVTSRTSCPSMRMRPLSTSKSRGTRLMIVDLPAPERPTSAAVLPPGTVSEKFLTASPPAAELYPNTTLSNTTVPDATASGRAFGRSTIFGYSSRSS